MIIIDGGFATEACKLKLDKIWYFAPFTQGELMKYESHLLNNEMRYYADSKTSKDYYLELLENA